MSVISFLALVITDGSYPISLELPKQRVASKRIRWCAWVGCGPDIYITVKLALMG
jgi:hypothetical protein